MRNKRRVGIVVLLGTILLMTFVAVGEISATFYFPGTAGYVRASVRYVAKSLAKDEVAYTIANGGDAQNTTNTDYKVFTCKGTYPIQKAIVTSGRTKGTVSASGVKVTDADGVTGQVDMDYKSGTRYKYVWDYN